jgi:hypothetical protein
MIAAGAFQSPNAEPATAKSSTYLLAAPILCCPHPRCPPSVPSRPEHCSAQGPERLHSAWPLNPSPRYSRQGEGSRPVRTRCSSPPHGLRRRGPVPLFSRRSPPLRRRPKPEQSRVPWKSSKFLRIPARPTRTPARVAVVATNTWAAIRGRNALAIEWKPGQYRDESTESLTAQLRAGLEAQGYWNVLRMPDVPRPDLPLLENYSKAQARRASPAMTP